MRMMRMNEAKLGGGARWVVAAKSSFQRYMICNFKLMTMMAKIMKRMMLVMGDGDETSKTT